MTLTIARETAEGGEVYGAEFVERSLYLANSCSGGDQQLKLPTDQDIERVMAFVEKAWRRFVEMIANIQKDMMRKG